MERQREVEQNFLAFQGVVGSLLPEHEGEYALMRDGKVVEVFGELVDAVVAGHSRFPDGMYSIQEVTTKPLDLGFYSHANPSGQIC